MSPRLFSYYSCWLSNLPAMRKYMREGGGGAQPLACAIVKVEAWSKTRFMVSSAEGFRRFRMFDLCDTQAQTQMTRLLRDSWTSVFIFQVVAMERWAESAAQRRRRRTRAGGTRPCVAPCSDLCCRSVFMQTKAGVRAPALCYKCHGAVTLLRDAS